MFIVGIVNYKTSIYMETQLKIYEKFAGEQFEIIILENSHNEKEFDKIAKIVEKFRLPIRIILGSPKGYSSNAHGTALQQIYELVVAEYPNVDYLLTQDPDFFWVKPNFLSSLKSKLQNYWVVGAPYPEIGSNYDLFKGHPWFPAAFGCAYRIEALKQVNADFRYTPGPPAKEVGWQIRESLCCNPYCSFIQEQCSFFDPCSFGSDPKCKKSSGHIIVPHKYSLDDYIIAYHLFFGSFEATIKKGMHLSTSPSKKHRQKLYDMMPPVEWQNNRQKACDFFWKEINNASR